MLKLAWLPVTPFPFYENGLCGFENRDAATGGWAHLSGKKHWHILAFFLYLRNDPYINLNVAYAS